MNPRRKKRLTIISIIFFGLTAVIGLVLYALSNSVDLFYTPSEIINGKKNTGLKPVVGQRLRIGGMVKVGSVIKNNENLNVSFIVFDNTDHVTVTYTGLLPDLFREGQGIVANGVLTENNIIKATEVLAKHDENYMAPEIVEAMKQQHTDVKENKY